MGCKLQSLHLGDFCKVLGGGENLPWFCLIGKRQRMNKKTEGPVQLLFCLVSLSHYKMVLFTKKKTICLLESLFYENTKKKTFSFVHETTSGLLVSKTEAIAGLLLFLDVFWKKGKDEASILFCFFADFSLLSTKFFLKLFFFFASQESFTSRSKTFENQTCKKALFFMPS